MTFTTYLLGHDLGARVQGSALFVLACKWHAPFCATGMLAVDRANLNFLNAGPVYCGWPAGTPFQLGISLAP